MSFLNKLLVTIGIVLSFTILGLIIYNQNQKSKKQLAIESQIVEQKELLEKIVRSQSEYASKKDIEDFVNQNNIALKSIKDDLRKLGGDVNAVNAVTFGSTAQKGTGIPTTNLGPKNPDPQLPPPKCQDGTSCPEIDVFGYSKHQQNLILTEKFDKTIVPLGYVGFSSWKKEPWTIDLKQRDYSVTSVIGRDENQRLYFYNMVSVTVDGTSYTIPIKKASTKEEYPEAKLSWWNPRLFMGADGGVGFNSSKGKFTPSLNVATMSYGRFKSQPDFSFAQVGVGLDVVSRKPQVSLTPATYNVGKHIPLMNNLYLGPSVHLGSDGDLSLMLGARVGL